MDPSVFSKSEIRRVKGDREKERETKRKKESLYRNTIYSSCHRDGGGTSYPHRTHDVSSTRPAREKENLNTSHHVVVVGVSLVSARINVHIITLCSALQSPSQRLININIPESDVYIRLRPSLSLFPLRSAATQLAQREIFVERQRESPHVYYIIRSEVLLPLSRRIRNGEKELGAERRRAGSARS